jgi:cytochrome P450
VSEMPPETEVFNPFDAGEPAAVFPRLRELRQRTPVVAIGEGMWYVTSYEESKEVLRDARRFSSAEGFRAPGVVVPPEDRMLGEMDAPQHPKVRRVVMSALNPGAISHQEGFIRQRARALLDDLGEQVDMVEAFTVPLPNDATVHLLGFPMEDAGRIAAWSHEVMESEWPLMNRTAKGEGMVGAFPEYTAYVDEHIAEVVRGVETDNAPDTLLGRLAALEVDGNRLSPRQLRALVFNLLLGGLTTTSQLLGNLLYEVLAADRVAELEVGGADARSRFIEESLRMYPPVLFAPRGCVRETTIGGVTIKPGDRVVVGTACANRDERVFADSEEFVANRPDADQHLTFGFGPHFCAGASMARTVARIGLEEFLGVASRRGARLEPGFRYENVPTFFEYGPRRLPVLLGH